MQVFFAGWKVLKRGKLYILASSTLSPIPEWVLQEKRNLFFSPSQKIPSHASEDEFPQRRGGTFSRTTNRLRRERIENIQVSFTQKKEGCCCKSRQRLRCSWIGYCKHGYGSRKFYRRKTTNIVFLERDFTELEHQLHYWLPYSFS